MGEHTSSSKQKIDELNLFSLFAFFVAPEYLRGSGIAFGCRDGMMIIAASSKTEVRPQR
jgi:hypothetical protein